MRGLGIQQGNLFSAAGPEQWVLKGRPICNIRQMVDTVLRVSDSEFEDLYVEMGRDSIPPEKLLLGRLLTELCTICSGRHMVEQL